MAVETEEKRWSILASTAHPQEDLQLSASDREAAEAVAEGLRNAKAANTRRAYGSAWHYFCVWALESGRESLPADPRTVALYLGHLSADGKAMATIALARAAISHAHSAAGIAKGDNPARHSVLVEMIKGWRNQAPAQKQASALTAQALTRIRETVRLPRRGRRWSHGDAGRGSGPGRRGDLAVIGVLAVGGLRRSVGAALTCGDVNTTRTARRASPSREGRTSPPTSYTATDSPESPTPQQPVVHLHPHRRPDPRPDCRPPRHPG